ncbi:cyclin-A1 [Sceloporus undulatus]|uniref:cyclin-A1 n=1 Tax=Sceloporus undulatus TaxID=8520 RepID=UPI001C4ADA07|nr:cyclin-A1 [Sceloporus undulatus]XP_042315367.1 cyclin-A1 [Sceloporus undulatus]
MLLSSKGDKKEQAGHRDGLSVIAEPHATQRAVLRELSENGQCPRPCVQGSTIARHLSGSENVCPAAGKSVLPSCLSSKQNFTIYIDDVEERSRCSYMAVEDVEPSMCEVDTSELKPNIHLLLNFSTGSPMSVDKSLQSQNEDLQDTKLDVMSVAEYAEDIHHYLREAEVKYRPKPCYMRKQPDITSGMRAVLVDWLVEVGEEYKLQTETLYLAVNYLDRFLSCMSVLRGKLQLVGTAAILLAAKYEEIYPPEVEEFVYITDDTYTKKQLLRMEHLLLKVLAFDLTVPTINQFLLQYLQRHGVSLKTVNFARYVAELSLLEADPFLKYLPSQMAAAAYCLANYTVNRHFWPEALAVFTGYSLSEIVPCLSDLHRACLEAPHQQQQAVREKYKLTKYMQVSLLEPPAVLPLQ